MNYTPNMNDSRVHNRIKYALGCAYGVFSTIKEKSWSTRELDNMFGRIDTDIGKFNRKYLLTCTNDHWAKDSAICKRYVLRADGCNYIRYLLSTKTYISFNDYTDMSETMREHVGDVADTDASIDVDNSSTFKNNNNSKYPIAHDLREPSDYDYAMQSHRKTFKKELSTLTFVYDDKKYRRYNKLQGVPRIYKHILLGEAGLAHQYDIECCAPTILMQYSRRGLNVVKNIEYPTIEAYIANRTDIRTQLATELELSYESVKKIITSLINGASLKASPLTAIFEEVGFDKSKMIYLQQDPFITALREDISRMWDELALAGFINYTKTKTGKVSKKSIKDEKWNVYFRLERRILDTAVEYMDLTGNTYFLEHDGWSTTNQIDIADMTAYISIHTGFSVKLEYKQYTNDK